MPGPRPSAKLPSPVTRRGGIHPSRAPSAAANPRGASGTPPPTMIRKASPYRKRARRPGAGRPTSHFSTVRRAGCPHPAASSRVRPPTGNHPRRGRRPRRPAALPPPPVSPLPPQKKRQVRTLALPCRLSYSNPLISPPAAPPARPFPRRCDSPPRRKFRRRGPPAHRG